MTRPTLETVLFLPDMHSPYHDKRAINLVERVVHVLRPTRIVLGGDVGDFYAVSSHSKDPKRRDTFEDEVAITKQLLRRIEGWRFKQKIFIKGNHENRLERYIMDQAPEMNGIVSIDGLLELTAHGWTVVEYKDHTQVGQIYVTHDLGKSGATAVRDALTSYQDNIVINHIHRINYIVEGNARGVPHVAASFGWLGDVNRVDYMYKVRANRDWALGFGVGYLRANGCMYLQPVPIIEYSCVVEGKLFTA